MRMAMYGTNGAATFERITRRNEGVTAFMERLAKLEQMTLKCHDGVMALIDMRWAQKQTPVRCWEVAKNDARNATAVGCRLAWLKVHAPEFDGVAHDAAWWQPSADERDVLLDAGPGVEVTDTAATSAVQAARWARGMLFDNNRRVVRVMKSMPLDTGIGALCRVDMLGGGVDGAWITSRVEHDFVRRITRATLLRTIETIW